MSIATAKHVNTQTPRRTPAAMEQLARQRVLVDCPYAFYFSKVTFHCVRGVITLRGRVRTNALKNVLDSRLADMQGIDRIENHVDVISSTGLSSVHPK